eukprot:9389531-Pyramimonas_sp.AAC.1
MLEPKWPRRCRLARRGRPWPLENSSGGEDSRAAGGALKQSGRDVGPSWAVLADVALAGPPWGPSGSAFRRLGGPWGYLKPPWAVLECSWPVSDASGIVLGGTGVVFSGTGTETQRCPSKLATAKLLPT